MEGCLPFSTGTSIETVVRDLSQEVWERTKLGHVSSIGNCRDWTHTASCPGLRGQWPLLFSVFFVRTKPTEVVKPPIRI